LFSPLLGIRGPQLGIRGPLLLFFQLSLNFRLETRGFEL
jgi:hypothetical protein